MNKWIFIVVIITTACSTPSVIVKKNVPIPRLGIYFERDVHANLYIAQQFESKLEQFLTTYNAKKDRKFLLYHAGATDSACLRIKLVTTRLVTPDQQTAGVLVSLMGFSLPFVMISGGAPFYVAFWYFPKAKSMTEFSLSPDINGSPQAKSQFLLESPGFLKSPENQINTHVEYFGRFIGNLVSQVEKQLPKSNAPGYAVQ